MQNKVLTIVVPSYNTAGFIDKNIPTFLDERILDELEILIVNDGSQDNTFEIAKKYEGQYPNTVHVVSKENGGHGSVINRGIEIAAGKYIKIVDGDDWVNTENLYRLVQDLKEQDADMVVNPYCVVHAVTNKSKLVQMEKTMCGKNQRLQNICMHIGEINMPRITYKTEILRKNGIRVREKCFYEDNEYNLFPMPFIETATILDYPVYLYLIGQSNQSISDNSVFKNRQMHYLIVQDCIKYYEKYRDKLQGEKRQYMQWRVMYLIRSQYNIYLRCASNPESFEEMMRFDRDFQKNYGSYYEEIAKQNPYLRIVRRGNQTIFSIVSRGLKMYRELFRR